MKFFFSGGCKNGKSTIASHLAVQLARGGPLYYVATMVPQDAEDEARIYYHVRQRAGLGFQTVEWSRNIDRCVLPERGATVLLDSVTALVQNEVFRADGTFFPSQSRVLRQLLEFAGQASHVIFVSDYIYSDTGRYNALTQNYCRALAEVDRGLAAACDTVLEVSAAALTVHKGTLPVLLEPLPGHAAQEVVIGGAGQGKLDYVCNRYGIQPEDIYVCTDQQEPDFSARFVCNLEQYVHYCVQRDLQPRAAFRPDSVLLCQDLFCGVVPMDAQMRRWREETGRYLARLSVRASHVTRIVCGLPQKLK